MGLLDAAAAPVDADVVALLPLLRHLIAAHGAVLGVEDDADAADGGGQNGQAGTAPFKHVMSVFGLALVAFQSHIGNWVCPRLDRQFLGANGQGELAAGPSRAPSEARRDGGKLTMIRDAEDGRRFHRRLV